MNFECKEYASSCLWENRYSPEPYSFTKNILLDFIIRPHVDFKSIYLCIDFSLLSEIDNIEYHKTLYYTIKGINMFETTSYLIDKPTIAIDYINKIISSNTLKAITNCISEIVYEVQKKVKYVLEKTLDIDVEAVNVYVQSIRVMD